MAVQVALLRGINVGTSRRIGMAALRDALAEAGHGEVRTHLQSGNLILDSRLSPRKLEQTLERDIEAAFGHDVAVVVRSAAQLRAVLAYDPLRDVVTDDAHYLVSFLSRKPTTAALERVAGADVGSARLVAHGRELYSWHPGGMQVSKLAPLLNDRHLGVTVTGRNFKTVAKLAELAAA
jgi:uncharacterized protein (DUF1697 family)